MANLKSSIDKLETNAGGGADAAKAIHELARKSKEEGEALKAWRAKKGHSEEEAAQELGVEHDPARPYAHGSYRPMESGALTNSVRAVIGIKPIEPLRADDEISSRNRVRQRHISMGLVNAELLSPAEEKWIHSHYAREMQEYEAAMKVWEENYGKH